MCSLETHNSYWFVHGLCLKYGLIYLIMGHNNISSGLYVRLRDISADVLQNNINYYSSVIVDGLVGVEIKLLTYYELEISKRVGVII